MESKTQNVKTELQKYQNLAKIYLDIIRKIEQRTPKKGIFDLPDFMTGKGMNLTQEEFEFIEANSYILQEQCNKFGLGVGSIIRPFGQGYFPYFESILNFPTLYKDPASRDEALGLISFIKTSLSTFLQKIEDILNDKEKMKDFRGISDKSKIHQELNELLSRFHRFIKQLERSPHKKSTLPTLSISNEYDVQHILYAVLKLKFDDVRDEEYTPSYAGGSTKMDFLLKNHKIVIEVKVASENLKDKDIGKQLIEDIAKYSAHPDCETLYCFIYDPNHNLINPTGLIKDLSKEDQTPKVNIIINPI